MSGSNTRRATVWPSSSRNGVSWLRTSSTPREPGAVGLGGAEAGIEEAGVVDAELAHRGVDRGHLGGLQHRDLHRLLGGQDVELAGVEQQLAAARLQRLPEVARVVAVLEVEVDDAGVAAGAEAGQGAGQVDADVCSDQAPRARRASAAAG